MKVKDLMKKEIVSVTMDTALTEAIKALFRSRISGLPVITKQGKLAGILSEKDAFRAMHPSYQEYYESPESVTNFERLERESVKRISHLTVKDVMIKEVVIVRPETQVLKIGALMLAKGIHRVPVVGKERKLLGIVTRRDIYRAIFRKAFDL